MNTHDKAPTGHHAGSALKPPALAKRAYQTPQVIELGDVRELTRGGTSGKTFDGPIKPAKPP